MDRSELDQGAAWTATQMRLQLAQMSGISQALERTATGEKGRQHLAELNQSIYRMLRIVERLEVSRRLSEEDGQLRPATVDLAQATREVGERLEGLLACAGVELTVSVPDRLGARVDKGLICQMVMELVANAAKAGRHVGLTLARQGDRAVFTVEDDGPGISPEQIAYLFHSQEEAVPDWRRDRVGVSVTRRIAQLHGGALMAECVPDRGLRVSAAIPLGDPVTATLESPGPSWDSGGFMEEMVALSELLPAWVFDPDNE